MSTTTFAPSADRHAAVVSAAKQLRYKRTVLGYELLYRARPTHSTQVRWRSPADSVLGRHGGSARRADREETRLHQRDALRAEERRLMLPSKAAW